MTTEQKWQIVLSRSPEQDGSLYYAVRTTGVYCRPSCPSRRPRRESVEFFANPGEAEQAGYRPCRRCRPTEIAASKQAVEAARRAIDESISDSVEDPLTLAELAARVGLSPFHLQRIFKRTLGVSPRQYQEAERLRRFKQEVRQGRSVTDAVYEAGFGSSSRIYEKASRTLGMTPGQYRRRGQGMTIDFCVFPAPFGIVLLAATDRGLCCLRLGDDAAELERELRSEFAGADLRDQAAALTPYRQALQNWLEGAPDGLRLPLDLDATAFQRKIWTLLQQIPRGETRTYQQVAEASGDARAVRAVAHACASNPVALVIPCHRVVRKDGGLAGYRWGLERKQALLEMEKRG